MIRVESDKIYFSSGRTAYANNGIVGLSPELEVTEGYDGGVAWPPHEESDANDALTAVDMAELADHMIERWARFRASLAEHLTEPATAEQRLPPL